MKTKLPHVPNTSRRIYIAGPMTNVQHFNYPAFHAAAAHLRVCGWNVVNPAEMGNKYGTPEEINADKSKLDALLRDELHAIEFCEAIFMLPGWERSPGAKKELAVALKHDARVILATDFFDKHTRNGDLIRYIEKTENVARELIDSARDRRDRYAATVDLARKNLDDAEKNLNDLERAATAAKLYREIDK